MSGIGLHISFFFFIIRAGCRRICVCLFVCLSCNLSLVCLTCLQLGGAASLITKPSPDQVLVKVKLPDEGQVCHQDKTIKLRVEKRMEQEKVDEIQLKSQLHFTILRPTNTIEGKIILSREIRIKQSNFKANIYAAR